MPLHFERLRVSGSDRAKFLHNFCTNEIRSLAVNSACEAFFTDVKAKILAHGYVLSFQDTHEIWMLPGDSALLQKHLSKYVITEDVTVESLINQVTLITTTSNEAHTPPESSEAHTVGTSCFQKIGSTPDLSAVVTGLNVLWSGRNLKIASGLPEALDGYRATLDSRGEVILTDNEFETLRIKERYPLIGVDMTSEHLAPEAERNSAAISYQKGCYLGQEPIARLDAMGHVNKALRSVRIVSDRDAEELCGLTIRNENRAEVGTLTSVCRESGEQSIGLSVMRLALLNQPLSLQCRDGAVCSLTVVAP
jgi:folate-binding protein YgfZ